MARSIFLMFAIMIICLSILTIAGVIENRDLRNQLETKTALVDSLQGECDIKDFTLDKYDFIITQFKEEYPKQADKVINETE